jgi:hypothetical protein
MEPRWKNKISEFLEMIPPLRGGDFQGITGLSSDDSLLVGVSTAREQSFKKAPALSNIGSMSPARLSLSTVASPHCRLLFHLAGKLLAEKNTKVVRAAENQASVITQQGAGSQATVVRFRSGEKYFLDIPLYRSGDSTQNPGKHGTLGMGLALLLGLFADFRPVFLPDIGIYFHY